MSNNILVINSGSSSIKFSLFDMSSEAERASGLAERLNTAEGEITIKSAEGKLNLKLEKSDYRSTLEVIINTLTEQGLMDTLPVAIGHRVVHGGEFFSDPVLVTADVIEKIKQCIPLAPLHNPAAVAGIEAMESLYPEIPQVTVFDTAFHQTLPPKAYLYGVPYELYEELGVRRYGMHGTSHQYVSSEAAKRLGLGEKHGILTAHLGNGCSCSAVVNGKCVDTTMGMTPLEGLLMGTRSGDVDPGLHQFLHDQKGWSIEEITNVLNKKSGLLGISGVSNDMRSVEAAAEEGNERAQLALDVFHFRLARQLGGLAACLPQLDALVFTGGIGENSRSTRALIINTMKILGIELDEELNKTNGNELGVISKGNGPKAIVVNTAEELMIARAAQALI
ncbi:acetate/propionate family kinase [Reinekea marinisedimentorum]|uniref:Acetate kinase n=1 Tax=Reinekea marinisedimentorum TaxID=230495 RepID=A0A4R3I665_9GAMM|nr:acetate kinase [Reinekea marinisedimentorum]TCS41399.1 acetate kinase [Reinekea marinisedimentorum]